MLSSARFSLRAQRRHTTLLLYPSSSSAPKRIFSTRGNNGDTVGVCYCIGCHSRFSFSWRNKHKPLLCDTATNKYSSRVNASLSHSPDVAPDVTAGELDHVPHTQPSPTKDLPPPPTTGFTTGGLFMPKVCKPPLSVSGPSSNNYSPTSSSPLHRKIPRPNGRNYHICPRAYDHTHR